MKISYLATPMLLFAGAAAVAQGQAFTPARSLTPIPMLITADDYPLAARRYDQQGQTSVMLTVTTAGRVSACEIALSSGSPVLDVATCRILQSRARFAPGRDRRGRPVVDVYRATVRWALSAPPAAQPVAATSPSPRMPIPRMPIPSYISFEDYPDAALRARQQGRVAVRLEVSTAGRVTGCTVTASSRSSVLDATTCRILRSRVRFNPARDTQGVAVTGTYSTFVDWSLPRPPVRPTA